MVQFEAIDAGAVVSVLCDADGCLFPSEEPAFEASAEVTNAFMEHIGSARRFEAEELRLATTGRNFRSTAAELAAQAGVKVGHDELERWVLEEKARVTAHLRRTLRPDPRVAEPLAGLASTHLLAVVSSSAMSRVGACLEAAGLDALFPPDARFSAEDSLDVPASKPDPAIYLHAGERLGITPGRALAIEDSLPGAQSAVAAGYATLGNVMFVPGGERGARVEELRAAGVAGVIDSWGELRGLLPAPSPVGGTR